MSDVNDNLILYLKLDEIVTEGDNKKVIDASGKSGNSEVKGNPQVVIDETFGSCLSFNGNSDYIYCGCLDFAKQNYTIEAWFKPSLLSTGDIFAATQTLNLHGILVELSSEGRMRYLHRQPAWDRGGINTFSEDTNNYNDNHWHHVAAIKKENEIFLYLDGKQISSQSNVDSFTVPLEVVIGRLCISHSDRYFQGQIAHVRIYNKALSPEEIKRDMDDDLSAITITSFNKTYPLDFNLYEGENKESVIFIDDGTQGQELILEISNNSEQQIVLPALSSNASASNYHFELRFRPETLSPTSLQQIVLKTTAGWSMSSPVTQFDDTVSLYFLASNNQVLGVNNPVSLTLQNINGAAGGGARTTRVELLCPQFAYQGEKVTNYYREKTLSIISHRGKKNIPLHVSFVESNRILNDGKTQNELILRIVNVLKDKSIPLIPASKGDEASKFIISFDVQEEEQKKDWALGTKSQVKAIEIKGKDFQMTKRHIEEWKIVKDPKGMSPTWTITNQNEENVKLSPEWGLELTISNIISLHPSGQTNLYISYENIPGYWDGTFICTIEKTPILYKNNVGIGIADPGSYKLNVEGGDTRLGGSLHLGGDLKISGNETNGAVEDYQIELCSFPIDNNLCSYIKIANISKEISIGRANANGLEVFIFSSNGNEKRQQVFYQRNLSQTEGDKGWNGLANWINNNAADGDIVAMISKLTYAGTHVVPVPSGGSAEQFFKSIGALKALRIVDHNPYALLFVKGYNVTIENLADTSKQEAKIMTTHHYLYPTCLHLSLEVNGSLKVVNGAITINQTTITEKQLQDLIKLLNQ